MNGQDELAQDRDTPPYLSGTTFYNFVESHRRTQPTRIDRSIMSTIAGGDQVRILAALRFFRLIEEDGTPTERFAALETLEGEQLQLAWRSLLRNSYPYLFSGFSLENATQGHIEEKFREQGIKGDTVRKAVTFFVTIAKFAGLELSPYFKSMRPRGPRLRKSPPRAAVRRDVTVPTRTGLESGGLAPSQIKVVDFKSGGKVVLRFFGDVVALTKGDRDKLFEWIDSMDAYANAKEDESDDS